MKKLLSLILVVLMFTATGTMTTFAQELDGFEVDTFDIIITGGEAKVDINWEEVSGATHYGVIIECENEHNNVKNTVDETYYEWIPSIYAAPYDAHCIIVYAYDEDNTIIAESYAHNVFISVILFDDGGLRGDVDRDMIISVVDATRLQRMLADEHEFNRAEIACSDVDYDGEASILDATYIQQYLASIEDINNLTGEFYMIGGVDFEIISDEIC